jgi:hypothetical protein
MLIIPFSIRVGRHRWLASTVGALIVLLIVAALPTERVRLAGARPVNPDAYDMGQLWKPAALTQREG